MHIVMISKANINLIVKKNSLCKKQDKEFLNALWEYVLYSKNISRTLPICQMCDKHDKFMFEGFGGIKKVGNGMMYIPKCADETYVIPDIVFHYFYVHNIVPTQEFKNAVIYGVKPKDEHYREIVREFYSSDTGHANVWKKVKCEWCGKPFEGTIAFKKGKNKNNVQIYSPTFLDKIFRREKYVGICYNCLNYTRV